MQILPPSSLGLNLFLKNENDSFILARTSMEIFNLKDIGKSCIIASAVKLTLNFPCEHIYSDRWLE